MSSIRAGRFLWAGLLLLSFLFVPVPVASSTSPGVGSFQIFLPSIRNGLPLLNVHGYVRDAANGQGLANARVYLLALATNYPVTTDTTGLYSAAIPMDKYDAVVFEFPNTAPYTYTQRVSVGFDGSAVTAITAPDILLDPNNATITGTIFDTTTGQPVTAGVASVTIDLGSGVEYNRDYGGNFVESDGTGHYAMSVAARSYGGLGELVERSACSNVNISSGPLSLTPGQVLTLNYGLSPCAASAAISPSPSLPGRILHRAP